MLIWLIFSSIVSVHCGVNVVCPDHFSSCPDSSTCCKLLNEGYGCCPLKNAVCCDDYIHCCPENTRCEAGSCLQLDGFNITAKKSSSSAENNSKFCFKSKFACPDSFTCCKDDYHCCPHDTVCDLENDRCIGKGFITAMYDTQKSSNHVSNFPDTISFLTKLNKPNNVGSVVCPGSSFQCPNGYTCCKLPSGDWGCCPFTKATCCADHVHCCPENMKCDPTSRTCFQGKASVPALLKVLSKPVSVGVTCPDNSTCAESMTCCELSNYQYGCCPFVDAVCCEDHSHCCPNGYVCDIVEKNCVP